MANETALKIVTANYLVEGYSVFLGADGWITDYKSAFIAANLNEAAALEAVARGDEAANRVVGVYLVDVELDGDGRPEPIRYREKLRASAKPSFWPDAPIAHAASRTARG